MKPVELDINRSLYQDAAVTNHVARADSSRYIFVGVVDNDGRRGWKWRTVITVFYHTYF